MTTPLVRLAPLDLIRGFVAVGRRMSVTLAAEDLCLTQSAVSRQIHSLEEALGVSLFYRGYRSITFTPAGERLFRTADGVVRQLQEVFHVIMQPAERRPVTVTASFGVASLWLMPRMAELQRAYPDIDVRVAANDRRLDLRTAGIDLAIRYAAVADAPARAIRLFDDRIIPVAHPSLGVDRLDADTLSRHVLLEYEGPRRPLLRWSDHLAAVGLYDAKPRGAQYFDQYEQVLQAALAGQGIALGRADLVEPLIAEGKLVALSEDKDATSGYAYWLVQAESSARQDVRDVAQWFAQQARMPAPAADLPTIAAYSSRAAASAQLPPAASSTQTEACTGAMPLPVKDTPSGERIAMS
jgi:LysR family transcriptional regulator, glycine cleavage system transcriptional activator